MKLQAFLTSSRREYYIFFRSPRTGLFSVKIRNKFLAINNFVCQWNEVRTTKWTPHSLTYRRDIKHNGYKSFFPNSWMVCQMNRSWINGLGKNPQNSRKSELIHWRQCLFVQGHRTVSPRTPRNICVYTRHPAQWHGHVWRVDTAPTQTRKKRNAC